MARPVAKYRKEAYHPAAYFLTSAFWHIAVAMEVMLIRTIVERDGWGLTTYIGIVGYMVAVFWGWRGIGKYLLHYVSDQPYYRLLDTLWFIAYCFGILFITFSV